MKKKDLTLILVIAVIAGVLSFLLSRLVFGNPQSRTTLVEVVEPISAEFKSPDQKIFNQDAINPTRLIKIGGEPQNQNPFD